MAGHGDPLSRPGGRRRDFVIPAGHRADLAMRDARLNSNAKVGLVLTGGGARAAYQVGALSALADILSERCPFRVLTGVSAGAINSAALASFASDFREGVESLRATWRGLSPDRVYRTDLRSLLSIGLHLVRQLGGGGLLGPSHVNALLDTSPLRRLVSERLSFAQIAKHLATGQLRAMAVTATNYHTGTAVTFFEGAADIDPWVRRGRLGRREALSIEHILASAAIPIFFPPVTIDRTSYGDGCVRLTAPLSPAIHLGADRIVAIGIRYSYAPEEMIALNLPAVHDPLSLSEIGGAILNSVFLDSLDSDVERTERINAIQRLMTKEQRALSAHRLRQIPLLVLRPSRDLGRLAIERYRRLPRTLRHFLAGIGATGERGWELVSYLAFEPIYLETLMELGYEDTRSRQTEIEAFFAAETLFAE
jgi:NTE family protein